MCSSSALHSGTSLWLHNQTVLLSQSSQATTEFQYRAYWKSTDQSLPLGNHRELGWRCSISTFTCTQESRLVEDGVKAGSRKTRVCVCAHCSNLITCSWSVITFLLSYLVWFFSLSLAFFKCVSEIWSYTLTFICPGWIQGCTSSYFLSSPWFCHNNTTWSLWLVLTGVFLGLPSYLSAYKLSDWWYKPLQEQTRAGNKEYRHARGFTFSITRHCLSVVRGCDLIRFDWQWLNNAAPVIRFWFNCIRILPTSNESGVHRENSTENNTNNRLISCKTLCDTRYFNRNAGFHVSMQS